MSRLAKKPLSLPEGVSVSVKHGAVSVKGPKGEMEVKISGATQVNIADGGVSVQGTLSTKQGRADAGTTWALIRNAVRGVSQGFTKILEIEGVGYRAAVEGDVLVLSLGYVNPVRFKIPVGISVNVDKNVITISGINRELVGRVAAEIRTLKKPEPYKGKGIRYRGEVIRRKVGKKAAAAAPTAQV